MKKLNQSLLLILLIILISVLATACAKKPYINVNYKPLAPPGDLKNKNIYLVIKDARSDTTIFSKSAEAELDNFTNLFALSLLTDKKDSVLLGVFDTLPLFKKAFSKRLENLGMNILTDYKKTEPSIEIALQKFFLDLVDRKWIVDISYQASMTKENNLIFKETISGKAERVKVFGQSDAEKALSEIFTSLINKLDIQKLLMQDNP
ncbi:MAG: hypothetical protein JSV38_01685 [Desulfobacterales bacterium]|nr:MAG: hypothetical protein JSV38_01685 [Desulfobacterales bacterium]